MANDVNKAELAIRQAILDRLKSAPRFADTLEGIVKWWLPRKHIEATPETVERLLHKLVQEGLLVSHNLPDGTVLYRGIETGSERLDSRAFEDDVSGYPRHK